MTQTEKIMRLLKSPMSSGEVREAYKKKFGKLPHPASVSNAINRGKDAGHLVIVGNVNSSGRKGFVYQVNPDYTPPKVEQVKKPEKDIKALALECLEKGDSTAKIIAKRLGAKPNTIAKYMLEYYEQGLVFRTKVKALNAFIYSLEDKKDSEFFLVDDEDERIVRKPAHFSYEDKRLVCGVWV